MVPGDSKSHSAGSVPCEELTDRIAAVRRILESCELCPRACHVDRTSGEAGFCGILDRPVVSSYTPHFGEEEPLVGTHGSGTIFMTGCNLGCMYCQNYDISHLRHGEEIGTIDLSRMMLDLQSLGCHNINFVTPTHQVPQILEALYHARLSGLSLPLVYNCGGYESPAVLKLLDGIVDIYMPDVKYMDPGHGKRLSDVENYPAVVKTALHEMHRQVGDLIVTSEGIATRGLLIRHLVLPDGLAGTREFVNFVAEGISKNTYINIMGQYRPCYKAHEDQSLRRRVSRDEVEEAREIARHAGLHRGFDRQ